MDIYLKIIIYILPIIIVSILFKYILKKRKGNNNINPQKESSILRIPSAYKIAPLFALGVCILIILYIIFFDIEDWPYIIVSCFAGIPFLIMSIMWSLWKVEIRDEDFVYRNWFGKTKVYRYEDLELRYHPKGTKWYFYKGDKKVFSMPYYIENGDKLARCYKKRYKKSKEKQDH